MPGPTADRQAAGKQAGAWPRSEPGALGVEGSSLEGSIAGALSREAKAARDMESYLHGILAPQPYPNVLGPLRDGAGASGVVVRRGYLIAEWGDPSAIEMSFSVSKSYLSLVAGLAFDRGLISDLRRPVATFIDHEAFSGPIHSRITWRQLLNQTSEWRGTLWDIPWWCDPQGGQGPDQAQAEPGTTWAYNDVRINLLALALTLLWERPLPEVLRVELMDAIGASDTWQWHGYRNSTIEIGGRTAPVVSGGAHWGGGFWASAYDHARVGALYLNRGKWEGRRLLSEDWVEATLTPCAVNPDYGLLWWLNRRSRIFPAAPDTGFCARGNLGRQLIWVDPARELVVVSRWSDDVGTLLAGISQSIAA